MGLTNTTGQALVDETGSATGAKVTWNTNGIWNLPITDTPGNARMMRGYLDTTGATTTVTVAGLPANAAGYDVYVYADGDNAAATRTAAYQISGTGITTTSINLTDAANMNFSGTYTQANNSNGNYVKFTVTATGFTITATPGASTDAYPRAPVNGIQIVPHVVTSPDFSITGTPSSQTVVVGNVANVHGDDRGTWRIYGSSDANREWPADRNDGGFFSGDVDGFGNFDTYGDDHGKHASRYLPADDHRDKRNADAHDNGEFGGECPAATTRLHDHGESQHADGDRWKHDDVHGNDWSIERVRRGGDAKRDGVTDGSDAEFLAGDGDWGREHRP